MADSAHSSCARGTAPASSMLRSFRSPALARATSGGSSFDAADCANTQLAHTKRRAQEFRIRFNYKAVPGVPTLRLGGKIALIYPRAALPAVFFHIYLELALGPLELPLAVGAGRVREPHVEAGNPGLQIDESDDHAAQVGDVADAGIHAHRGVERDGGVDRYHVLGFDGKQEVHQHGLLGVADAEGQQHAVNGARRANGRAMRSEEHTSEL